MVGNETNARHLMQASEMMVVDPDQPLEQPRLIREKRCISAVFRAQHTIMTPLIF